MLPTDATNAHERTEPCVTIEGLNRQILRTEPYE